MTSSPVSSETSAPRFRWEVADLAPREHLSGFPDVHPLLIQLLWNRQIREPAEIAAFLNPVDAPVPSPWLLRGVAEAVERIRRARTSGELVAIYGDYDVDGVTSTALLTECLDVLGVTARPFVPRRDRDGYGLNCAALDRLREEGVGLVVAVDCGISGAREVEHARQIGLDVVVVDHHHVPPTLPNAVAVINPRQVDCPYPFKDLCAVGLVDKLARALLEREGHAPSRADCWLDLVALGTVADVVPLRGENRSLVVRGLRVANPPTRPGLRALARAAGLPAGRITSEAIAYALAPRLNAAGRLADAEVSLRLLLTRSEVEAEELAAHLDRLNRQRQELTNEALDHARDEILRAAGGSMVDLPKLLIVASEAYAAGVVGLVAARLVEEFHRPAFVAERTSEAVRGSARSIDGFHVTDALTRCRDVLERFGGHARAAGFTAHPDNYDELRQRLGAIAAAEISDEAVRPRLKIDAQLHLRRFDHTLDELIARLVPFGYENPRPIFLSRRVRLVESRLVGKSRDHLRLSLADAHTRWNAIGFGMGERTGELAEYLDLVYVVERNEWNGQSSVRLRLLDFMSSIAKS